LQDTKLFETILGIQTPWRISCVALDTTGERVDLWAEHAETRWPCPECQQALPCHDHADERMWRHLDTCQYQTFLHARVPRVDCPTHGVRQVRVPWAEPRSRFTVLMERLVIDLIQQCNVLRFVKHPITNGVAEGLNSKIMSIKRKAGGFRNPSNFTTAIYFHCGGLDLYPR